MKSVWVLWRFIHPKPLRKTRFYDNRTRKSVISRNCLSFWSLNWICILNVDIAHLFGFMHFLPIIDSLRPKIPKKRKKWRFSILTPLAAEIELWRIYLKRCARSNYGGNWWLPIPEIPNSFYKICD